MSISASATGTRTARRGGGAPARTGNGWRQSNSSRKDHAGHHREPPPDISRAPRRPSPGHRPGSATAHPTGTQLRVSTLPAGQLITMPATTGNHPRTSAGHRAGPRQVTGQGPLPRTQRGPNYVSVTTHAVLDGRGRTPVDCGQLVRAVSAKAMHVPLCLRDEEATWPSARSAGRGLRVGGCAAC